MDDHATRTSCNLHGDEDNTPSSRLAASSKRGFEAEAFMKRIVVENGGPVLRAKPGAPAAIPVFSVGIEPGLFQVRTKKEPVERQVTHLMKMLKIYDDLDPIHVLWTGSRTIVIEGHHRRAAYWRERGDKALIPVRWFEGPIKGAIAAANATNGKQSEPITSRDRQNFAWLLVKLSEGNKSMFTKPEVVREAGVSNGQVGRMRTALNTLGAKAFGIVSWEAAAVEAGLSQKVDFDKSSLDELSDTVADDMLRRLKPGLPNNPKLLAAALLKFCGRKAEETGLELVHMARHGVDWTTETEAEDEDD